MTFPLLSVAVSGQVEQQEASLPAEALVVLEGPFWSP